MSRPTFSAGSVVNAASFVPGISPGSIATLFGANLLDASVSIDNIPVTVFFTSNRQVNFLVPDNIPEGSAQVSITTSIGSTDSVDVPVTAISPGLFAAVNRGTYIEIYATGLRTTDQPKVIIGSAQAEVLYSGVAPGFPGLYQINATMPPGTPSKAPVLIQIGAKQSNTVPLQ